MGQITNLMMRKCGCILFHDPSIRCLALCCGCLVKYCQLTFDDFLNVPHHLHVKSIDVLEFYFQNIIYL